MKYTRLFIFLVFSFCCAYCASAQRLDSTLNVYHNNYLPERLHFHLDRDKYVTGETIWFKVYTMSGFEGSGLSKNLYVDWIDDNAKILAHQICPISSTGATCGQFEIPKDFTGNVLHLHAYTQWMLNFDSAFLYNREIQVFNQKKRIGSNTVPALSLQHPIITTPALQADLSNPTLQFFPEGGNAVAGINSRIAFLCCDRWGRPVKATGVIKDSKGNSITELQVQHDGMGYFWLLAAREESYSAEWKDEKGNTHHTKLPAIQSEGIVLSISNAGGNKRLVIQRSEHADDKLKQLHVIATMQQTLVYTATATLYDDNSTTGIIPEMNLPTGSVVVTVFNSAWQPVAERLCFIDHPSLSTFSPTITWEVKSLDKRGYNQLLITLPDSIPANMSIAVTDAGLPSDSINSNTILSQLLLSGDIRGRVYNPDYYFTDTTADIQQHLDLVMLTHGWRRYDWDKIIKGEHPKFSYARDTAYYTLAGKVSGISQKKLAEAAYLFLVLKGKDSSQQNHLVPLQKDGSFAKPDLLLFDSTTIYYKLNGIKGLDSRIRLSLNDMHISPTIAGYSIARNTPLYAPENMDTTGSRRQQYFINRSDAIQARQLASVTVIGHRKTQLEKMDDLYVNSGLFKSSAMRSYAFDVAHDNLAGGGYLSLEQYLAGRVPGYPDGSSWRNVTYYVDEMQGGEIPPLYDIAYVKAFPPPFVGAPLNGAAIVIYTKKGKDLDDNIVNVPSIITKGYTPLKEFYQPDYGGKDSASQQEDIRPTIYWNPILLTGRNANKIRLAFYNNDISKGFKLILEGINEEGKLTHIAVTVK